MRAAAIEQFGGTEQLKYMDIPVPVPDKGEILIRMAAAGVGAWDPREREGEFARFTDTPPAFPYVLGSDGAGEVVALGEGVDDFRIGDMVYAFTQMKPKGGFYAEYAVASAEEASLVPPGLSLTEAGAMPVDAMTALRGLEDTLQLRKGESVMIFGASGGVGHLALQLAVRIGARVFAVASGEDGVELAQRLGAEVAVCGRTGDVLKEAARFAPEGIDAALLTAGGKKASEALQALKARGRVAYPNGAEKPEAGSWLSVSMFSGYPDPTAIGRLNQLINMGAFKVHVAQTFALSQAAEAQRALDTHYLGKLALVPEK